MSGTVIVARDGNQLMILPEKGAELPKTALKYLQNALSYNYKTCDWRGNVTTVKKPLYAKAQDYDLITTGIGLSDKVSTLLKNAGVQILYKDSTPSDRDTLKIQPNWDYLAGLSFRPRQRECLEAITRSYGGIIVAPTGFGKTYLIGVLGRLYPQAKIHVCTKSVDIARRIYSDLCKLLPSVGMLGGGSHETEARVTVVTADSLAKVSGDCDFFFFDECHQAAAETYTNVILNTYKYARRYGFTATPEGRSDGADPVLGLLFGEEIFTLSYQEGVDLGLVVQIKVRWIQCDCPMPPAYGRYQTTMGKKRTHIWTNQCRNELIASDIAKQPQSDSILVLVETIEHALTLQKELPDFEICYSNMTDTDLSDYKKSGLVPEDYVPLTKKDRIRLCEDFASGKIKRVISTDVWSTGVDFPSLSTVYLVSGRASRILNTQGGGRASRLFSGKKYGTVVDIQDCFSSEFAAYARKRHKTYTELGWEQKGYR